MMPHCLAKCFLTELTDVLQNAAESSPAAGPDLFRLFSNVPDLLKYTIFDSFLEGICCDHVYPNSQFLFQVTLKSEKIPTNGFLKFYQNIQITGLCMFIMTE